MGQTGNQKSPQVTAAIITGIFAVVAAIVTGLFLIANTIVITNPTRTPLVTAQTCAYASDDDAVTIAKIIQAEAVAVNTEDISIIQNIFAQDAIIRSEGDGTTWNDPVAYYSENFDTADVINAVHFSIKPTEQGIKNDTAYFTSGSSGTIIFTNGERLDYYNELGKDTWVLKKNSSGCWVIVKFTFN